MITDQWKKSTRSGSGGNCLYTRRNGDRIEVKDGKLGDASPVLSFTQAEWQAHIEGVRLGECDI